MSTVLWIVGEPGIGKTTLARALIKSLTGKDIAPTNGAIEIAKPKWTLFPTPTPGGIAAAGHWRGDKFDGADTLPISDIKPAMEYWRDCLSDYSLTILDGDKLSTCGAVEVVRPVAKRTLCVLLTDDEITPHIAAERRAARGTTQNATWVKGRKTKAENFFYKQFAVIERAVIMANRPFEAQLDLLLESLGTL